MHRGERFEIDCWNYLQVHYATKETAFVHHGAMDSTKSDIAVMHQGQLAFYIEAKDAQAQSGQFVLLPQEQEQRFVFSPKNHSQKTAMTNRIIAYMNRNFSSFRQAGTKGRSLEIPSSIMEAWILHHYRGKQVKYLISRGRDYVILPIEKFGEYFAITATYRMKRSGSQAPAKRDWERIRSAIRAQHPSAVFTETAKDLLVQLPREATVERFPLQGYTYYLSPQGDGSYRVRRLSNTDHSNVIFSIQLKKEQEPEDLQAFLRELACPSSQKRI